MDSLGFYIFKIMLTSNRDGFTFFFFLRLTYLRGRKRQREKEKERENPQAGSLLSTEPDAGLDPGT